MREESEHRYSSWLSRFQRWLKITHLSTELVRFDTQAMENPEINGVEYQQGELLGFEFLVRAVIPKGKHKGTHVGRVSVRSKGSFVLKTVRGSKIEASAKYFRRLQHADGYAYTNKQGRSSRP